MIYLTEVVKVELIGLRKRLSEPPTYLLERVIVVQEQQQTSIEQSFRRIEQTNERINQLYEEIKGLRTESLRIQRHVFGDEVDGN